MEKKPQYVEPFITKEEAQHQSDLEKMLSKPLGSAYASIKAYKDYEEIAKQLSQSPGIPKRYRGNVGGCVMALDLANRMNAHVLAVMQNLYEVHGQPAWSAKFARARVDASGMFTRLEFHSEKADKPEDVTADIYYIDGNGQSKKKTITERIINIKCWATATDLQTGREVVGPKVSIKMAVQEGWYSKPGSKWKTMVSMMLIYRATSFFVNAHCPGLLMGLLTVEEAQDIGLNVAEKRAIEAKGTEGLKATVGEYTPPEDVREFLEEMEEADKAKIDK